jgi:hypothetical protein
MKGPIPLSGYGMIYLDRKSIFTLKWHRSFNLKKAHDFCKPINNETRKILTPNKFSAGEEAGLT